MDRILLAWSYWRNIQKLLHAAVVVVVAAACRAIPFDEVIFRGTYVERFVEICAYCATAAVPVADCNGPKIDYPLKETPS